MKKWRPGTGERYNIIISSSDPRKKTAVFSVSRRLVYFASGVVVLGTLTIAGTAAASAIKPADMYAYAESIDENSDSLILLYDTETEQAADLNDSEGPQAIQRLEADGTGGSGDPLYDDGGPVPVETFVPEEDVSQDSTEESGGGEQESALQTPGAGGIGETSDVTEAEVKEPAQDEESVSAQQLVPMKDAIARINADFDAYIQARVDALEQGGHYDSVKIEYDGDLDGDSDKVNNWADVISVFAAETMYDGQKLMNIESGKVQQLRQAYFDMNQVSFRSETSTKVTSVNSGKDGVKANIESTLTIYITVESLTYLEAAQSHDFDKKQQKKMQQLMSPSYYIYFDELLDVDIYDGLQADEIKQIMANLPQGTKGAQVVQAALIRLGNPYSKARRGSGNYVDCSYFTYWSYSQAGIKIPTSSVEQARFCYYYGQKVDYEDIQPGDLVFWSKRDCDCGRWHEIHHVGIYIGDNKVIEASSSKGRVVIRNLWGLKGGAHWKIYMFGRPYEQE